MDKNIPLIHKSAAMIQIDKLKPFVQNIWPMVNQANLPIYLDSTSAQSIPFTVFSRLLHSAFEQLPHHDFIAFIQQGADTYVKQFENLGSPKTLNHLSALLPIQRAQLKLPELKGSGITTCLELTLEGIEPFSFVEELYAICVAHHVMTQEYGGLLLPSKYHLLSQTREGLDKLNISTDTPQFMGQANTAIFYDLKDRSCEMGLEQRWENQAQPFTTQVSSALESYIGRQDLSLVEFSEVVEIPPRTIQRYLGKEASSYRKIKESLNMKFAKRVMSERNASISDISEHLGYADTSQFIRAFKKSENITPLQWRKKTCETHLK
ncbi:AraC family transcriptional regulator [Vibrio makurazakiensis]|uniref:helix-turn-helix domain-containing protein n=1 Tax=Vibrio makurazakiensis TaxID=2910250 RepID=UPI003D14783D